MDPPDNALILCVDEKTQIHRTKVRALERAQHTIFPQKKLPPHQSHDYYRHGTTTLFTALDYLTGKVIGDCKDQHTSEDYLKFIKKLDRQCEKGKELHIIVDNYKTHTSKLLQGYIAERPTRFVLHFTPTHSSWLNLVERFFREITTERIRRESADLQSENSVDELICAIRDYIKTGTNQSVNFTGQNPAMLYFRKSKNIRLMIHKYEYYTTLAKDIKQIIPPPKNAVTHAEIENDPDREYLRQRNDAIDSINELDRDEWKEKVGYHKRSLYDGIPDENLAVIFTTSTLTLTQFYLIIPHPYKLVNLSQGVSLPCVLQNVVPIEDRGSVAGFTGDIVEQYVVNRDYG
jgi:transposase